ncbi:hypothetical protein IWZ00DRAFT_501018 [Phyllosticta capitalensis]
MGATGCLAFNYEAGPHGMVNQEARFADDVVVRVWVDRFVRAPGVARQDELQLEDDPQKRKPDVHSAPHGWQAKVLWVIKCKEVEVRQTRKAKARDIDSEEVVASQEAGDDMIETEETKLLSITDLGAYTVLDAANRDASKLALDRVHPTSNKSIDAIQARCDVQTELNEMVAACEASETAFKVEFDGEEELVVEGLQSDSMRTTKRVITTFWVEISMLQGPRNI